MKHWPWYLAGLLALGVGGYLVWKWKTSPTFQQKVSTMAATERSTLPYELQKIRQW